MLVQIHLLIDELFATGGSNLLVRIHLLIDELSALPTGLMLEITNAYKKAAHTDGFLQYPVIFTEKYRLNI